MDTTDFVTENIPLVYALIRKYYPAFIHDEDVVQSGMAGLCVASKNYNEKLGKFSTYAAKVILNAIRLEFRSRFKHSKVTSLSTVITEDGEGDVITVEDIIPGDEDIDFVDIDTYLSKLTEKERKVVELRQLGYTLQEISDEWGVTRQAIGDICRRIKIKWSRII